MELNTYVAVILLIVINNKSVTTGCRRNGRSLLAQERSATEIFQDFRHDLNMNVDFGLRKIGINSKRGSSNATKCYGNLGCLHITEDWYGMTRPVNVLPSERHIINTQFLLRSRDNLQQVRFLNLSQPFSITTSPFVGARPTKIIIHGFIDTGFVPWITEMSNLLLINDDVNVIAVDWGGGSARLYSQSAANARLVGLEVAALINYLVDYKNAKVEDFHIIGHSLGAHIAGYAGEKLISLDNGKLGRITALDPAQPLFQDMPEFVRLDPGDAEFVDVIHTDAKSILMGGYGMESPCGHVDFYPNGGADQPGCSLFDMPVSLDSMVGADSTAADTMGRHLVACSHNRGIDLYIESLRSTTCDFMGHECHSYEAFEQGNCFACGLHGEKCAILGERAIEYKQYISAGGMMQHHKFYLKTGKKSSFCQHHYLLEFNLAQPWAAERWVQGFLKVNLYGTQSEITDVDLTPDRLRLEHGGGHKLWVHSDHFRGYESILSVEAYWLYYSDYMNPNTYCLWNCNDKLYVDNVTISSLTGSGGPGIENAKPKVERTVVCGDSEDGYATIKSGGWKLFYKECY